MSEKRPFRGVFTIPATPFKKSGEIDWQAFRNVLDFCVDCGAHGIVWPVNASAFPVLTDQERLAGMETVVEQVAGRIPVVLGVQGVSAQHAQMFSRRANAVAADAVIAMTPYVQALEDEGAVMQYYAAIAGAARLPVFIQNHTRGSVLSIATMARLIREIEYVDYVKEETFPVTHMITGLIEQAGPSLKGVFGGAGGRFLLLEHPRGVAGQMPGCHVTDVVVRLWNALDAGDREEAKRVFGHMAPLFALETLRGTYYPEVLRRRGVIPYVGSRLSTTSPTVDVHDHAALDEIMRDLAPLFTWQGGPLIFGAPVDFEEGSGVLEDKAPSSVDTFDQVG